MSNPNIESTPAGLAVYPTGTYPTDLTNVQSAVDTVSPNGTLLLRAVSLQDRPQYFNFGDDVTGRGSVKVRQDVVISGESMLPQAFVFPNGQTPDATLLPDRTVIYGGNKAFHCRRDNPVPTTLTVRRIFFAYPAFCAVQVAKSSGLEVSGCIIYDIKRATPLESATPVVSVGIEATGGNQPAPDLRGEFRVFDNMVKRSEDLMYGRPDTGIAVQNADMRVDIHGNRISGFALAGIGLDRSRGEAIIRDNEVISCGHGREVPQSAGIGVKRCTPNGPGPAHISVTSNRIVGGSVAGPAGSQLPSRNGICLWGSHAVTVTDNLLTGAVESNGILVMSYVPPSSPPSTPIPEHSVRNVIARNDLRALVAGHAQEAFEDGCSENRSMSNDFGALDLGAGVAGVVVHSNDNELTNETFWGLYPGTAGSPDVACVWLVAGTQGNRVMALKRGGGPPAFDLCTQIQNDGPANVIPGYERCAHVELADILQREREHCQHEGGTWSEAAHSCTLVDV
jgi:hypothetical protein